MAIIDLLVNCSTECLVSFGHQAPEKGGGGSACDEPMYPQNTCYLCSSESGSGRLKNHIQQHLSTRGFFGRSAKEV